MKKSDIIRCLRLALLGAPLFLVSPAGAQERANPEAEPVEDQSRKANPESEPVTEDREPADEGSRPVEDQSNPPNEEAEPVEDDASTASEDSEPVQDESDRRARRPAGDRRPEQARGRESSERSRSDRQPAGNLDPDDARRQRPGDREQGAADPRPPDQPDADAMPQAAREAEAQVRQATEDVARELEQRKMRIRDEDEAQQVIEQIIGGESPISRAEIAREERAIREPDERSRDPDRPPEATAPERQAAVDYFRRRLRGEPEAGPPPAFFRRGDSRRLDGEQAHRARRDARRPPGDIEAEVRPRYLHEGRRYVHYDSRAEIPAILLAAEALNRVNLRPAREVAPMFFERQEVSRPADIPPPPENYRDEDAWVVSYPVNENSMITSEDILFMQGSTRFADRYSYDIVSTLADAMKDLPSEERFVIEGHASAEGDYDYNIHLSQQRAERIVREMVRRGVSPHRLIPVGYGESEALYPADAAESLRRRDRRVMVFNLSGAPDPAR